MATKKTTRTRMKPEIRDMWVAALESRQYKQGKNYLRTDDKFCCLGVLCDLHRQVTKRGDWADNGGYMASKSTRTKVEHSLLPPIVRRWAGLSLSDPNLGAYTCSAMNDGTYRDEPCKEYSFRAMAKKIKAHL